MNLERLRAVPAEYRDPQTYVERYGVDIQLQIETLAEPPERPLSHQDRETFFAIDHQLVEGKYTTGKGELVQAEIEGWDSTPPPSINVILDFFQTPEGLAQLAELEAEAGISAEEVEQQHSHVAAARRLALLAARLEGDRTGEEKLKILAENSHEYQVSRLAAGDFSEDPVHVYLYPNPQYVIDQSQRLQNMREFMRAVRLDTMQREDLSADARDALLVEIDGYRQSVADLLGKIYPAFIDIYHQALLVDDVENRDGYTNTLLANLQTAKGSIYMLAESIVADDNTELEKRFAHTMDRWRNGFVKGEEDTPFSHELLALEDSLERRASEFVEQPLPSGAFTPEEVERLDAMEFDSEAIADMFRYFLERNNLLSHDTDYKPNSWPADSTSESPKIGVIVGEYKNLRYGNGWLYVPRRTKRKLRQRTPSGPAFVVPHELEHAIDGITAEYGEQQVGLARATARMSNGVREGIGKQAENQAAAELFGQDLGPSLNYVKALRTIDETESETAAIRAFADQAAKENGLEAPTPGILKTAENRVQRLIGLRGRNTQALVYIEQELLALALDTVSDDVRQTVAANSSLDVRMQTRLHEFGLLSTDRFQPEVPPIQAVEEYLRNRLELAA